jgi:hypothetical protein
MCMSVWVYIERARFAEVNTGSYERDSLRVTITVGHEQGMTDQKMPGVLDRD